MLEQLRDQRGVGILLITHDCGVGACLADGVAVMYAGAIVEIADV
jgi:ABC-type dipeptide/oligopeptide/nickel transport system ATPase component